MFFESLSNRSGLRVMVFSTEFSGSNLKGGIGSIVHHPIGEGFLPLSLPGILYGPSFGGPIFYPKPTYYQNHFIIL